ncbi:MAG TPA: alkaline phosphatase family protein [Kofleriaceae bacterium]
MHRTLFVLMLASCASHNPEHHDTPEETGTRLVVLVVVDQWPEWSFEKKQSEFHAGGFDRLLSEGEWHVGHHPSAATLTAPGHALLGTGEPTAGTGILANEWWHRDLGKLMRSTEALDGSVTPEWLEAPAIGDAIAAAGTGAKSVSVSLKDRASVLPLGRHGTPIWLDVKSHAWTTLGTPPAWLADWNRSHPPVPSGPWTPLDAAKLAKISGVADDQPGEVGEHGFGKTFPHDPAATKDPAMAIYAMPAGNEAVLDTALAAIKGEQLGQDRSPDLLVVSLSAHDWVGHGWGHESWEMWDLEMRLDDQIGKFMTTLDQIVGAGRWSMIVTSDHGASPLPETLRGGRIDTEQIRAAANAAASSVLGPGNWIDDAHYPNVYFSKAMLAQSKGELESAAHHVIFALRSFPGIEEVGAVADVAGNCDHRTGRALALCLTFEPSRSGDVYYLPAKGWIFQDANEPEATAHGSLHDYDQLVPVILMAPDRKSHEREHAPVAGEIEMVKIAPLLARWLGVNPPSTLPRPPPPADQPPPPDQGSDLMGSGSGSGLGSGSAANPAQRAR